MTANFFFSDEGNTNSNALLWLKKNEAKGEVRVGVSEENLKSHFIVFFFLLLFRKRQTTAFVQTHAVLTTTKLWNKLPFTFLLVN